jgi:hypothetical protein
MSITSSAVRVQAMHLFDALGLPRGEFFAGGHGSTIAEAPEFDSPGSLCYDPGETTAQGGD